MDISDIYTYPESNLTGMVPEELPEDSYHWATNPAPFTPYASRKLTEHSPVAHPTWFATKDVKKELAMLKRMQKKYGWHHLRFEGIATLDAELASREGK